jgi:hypothetical protein
LIDLVDPGRRPGRLLDLMSNTGRVPDVGQELRVDPGDVGPSPDQCVRERDCVRIVDNEPSAANESKAAVAAGDQEVAALDQEALGVGRCPSAGLPLG